MINFQYTDFYLFPGKSTKGAEGATQMKGETK